MDERRQMVNAAHQSNILLDYTEQEWRRMIEGQWIRSEEQIIMEEQDRVKWVLKRLKGGLADELKGLNEDGGEKALKYATELLEQWAKEGREALEQDIQENANGKAKG